MSKVDIEKADDTLKILGVRLNSTKLVEVLNEAGQAIGSGRKLFIVTPNPEFLVLAQKDPEFKKILNSADLAIPDGFGLVLASRFLGTKPILRRKLAGADLVTTLLKKARLNDWRVGVIGARRGKTDEQSRLLKRLKIRYPGLKIDCLEQTPERQSRQPGYQPVPGQREIVFACQGMGEQEKWIADNIGRTKAWVFMGIGGSLDFLTGFSRRAPQWWQNLGLEWLWRLRQRPRRHLKRIINACLIFPALVFQEKIKKFLE